MTKLDKSAIRFKCTRCFSWLGASPSQVGTKQRCPRCQMMVRVPTAEQAAAAYVKGEDYELSDRDEMLAPEPSISFDCPTCNSRLSEPEDQVGRETKCPDCHTLVVVPPPPAVVEKRRAEPGEDYKLQQQADAWGITGEALRKQYYSIHCPLCGTMAQATAEIAGREIECPDCQEPFTVGPPPKRRRDLGKESVEAGRDDEYALRENESWDRPAAEQSLIAVKCGLCGTLIQAAEDQVGQEMMCPDCDELIIVPRPKRRRKPQMTEDEYATGSAMETPKFEQAFPDPRFARGSTKPGEGPQYYFEEPPKIPRRWYFDGVFEFPAYPTTYMRWLSLSMIGGMLAFLIASILAFAFSGDNVTFMMAAVPFSASAALGIVWMAVAGAHFLVIIRLTSFGHDQVEDWPPGMFVDWMFDFLYFFLAAVVSIVPAAAPVWAFDLIGIHAWPLLFLIPLLFSMLFPFVLMSMLEGGSPFHIVTPAICKTLVAHRREWALFWVEGTLVVALAGGVSGGLIYLAGLPAILFVAPVFTGALIVYFRLLGRLAWWCSTHKPDVPDDQQKEDEEPSQ